MRESLWGKDSVCLPPIPKIEFRGHFAGWQAKMEHVADEPMLELRGRARVPAVETGNEIQINFAVRLPYSLWAQMNERERFRWIAVQMLEFMMHEAKEAIWVDGVQVLNPHVDDVNV